MSVAPVYVNVFSLTVNDTPFSTISILDSFPISNSFLLVQHPVNPKTIIPHTKIVNIVFFIINLPFQQITIYL